MDANFISALRKSLASRSIGASTARGMGPKGTIAAARSYLAQLDLSHVGSLKSEEDFKNWLNEETYAFLSQLPPRNPPGGEHWGSARKFLNLFLRAVVYNRFLCKAFDLYHIEPWLEIPLDSHVAEALREEPEGSTLPSWKTVVGLDQSTSELYQNVASKISDRMGLSRVHLDVFYWRRD